MLRLRSCASSMMMVLYFRSSLSRWISASRMPSVISLILVAVLTSPVKRTWNPTSWPISTPIEGDAFGNGARGKAARLGVADQALVPEAEFQAHFGDLGGLAGTGFAGDDGHLVCGDGRHQVLAALGDGQLCGVGNMKCHGC